MSLYTKQAVGGESVRFRKYTTYNRKDTHIIRTGSETRIKVKNGVEKRCNLLLHVFIDAFRTYGTTYLRSFEIMRAMEDLGTTYSYTDVQTAISKCVRAGILERIEHGRYRITFNPDMLQVAFVEPR